MTRRATLWHLTRRFVGSLRPGGPAPADDRWARAALLPGEQELWSAMTGADRRHSVGVARRADELLEGQAPRAVLAAALLHDVGKVRARLGTFGRVAATVTGAVVGRRRAAAWDGPDPLGRVGRYLRHDALGAQLLLDAGSDPLTVTWAAEHHRPPSTWTLPPDIGAALKSADDD